MWKTVAALGTFDGVHIGHAAVLRGALSLAGGYSPVALSFAGSPRGALSGSPVPLLLSDAKKAEKLREAGFRRVVLQDFAALRDVSAEEYLTAITREYGIGALSCGFNYRFGEGARGDTELLGRFCRENGIRLFVAEPVLYGGEPVSSSRVRGCVAEGELADANAMLGYPFAVEGEVTHGFRRGRTLGFPTINQELDPTLVTPRRGVYRSRVTLEGGVYRGLTNIGCAPTFGGVTVRAETYLEGFSGDAYGRFAVTELLDFVRPEEKFPSPDALRRRIAEDFRIAFS